MRKIKEERETNLDSLFRKIKDFFYSILVAIHAKLPKSDPSKAKNGKLREFAFFHLIWILPMIQFGIIYIFVNIKSILMAFQTYDKMQGKFIFGGGVDNFSKVFRELFSPTTKLGISLKNSTTAYLVSLLVVTPLALLFSYYMFKKMKFSEFFRTVLFVPSILSPVILASIYLILMDKGAAIFLSLFNGGKVEIQNYLMTNQTFKFPLIITYTVITGFGTNILMYANAMSQISDSVIEAAELDGASFFREFFSICLPLIYPTITTFLTVGIVGFFTNQTNVYSFYGEHADDSVYTLGYYMFYLVSSNKASNIDQYPFASAMGVTFSLVAIPITLGMRWALEKFGPQTEN